MKWVCLWVLALIIILSTNTSVNAGQRIVGGNEAEPGEWQWMAAVAYSGNSLFKDIFCGGSLIHPKWVITAAHCVYGERPINIEIAIGVNNLKTDIVERIGVKRIIIHPKYNYFRSDDFDIALIELEQSVSYPILSLFTSSESLEGKNAVVMGWGEDERGFLPSTLQEVTVKIVSNDICNEAFNTYDEQTEPDAITERMLCAADIGKDSCFGDSGGPLVVNDGGEWKQVGIVSWGGDSCADPNLYGVYTRITAVMDFINDYVHSFVIERLAADFGEYGLYLKNSDTWRWIAGDCESIAFWGDRLLADFGNYGLYVYDGSEWKWIAGNPESIEPWGDRLAANFNGYGLYIYDDKSWKRIHHSPQNMESWGNLLVLNYDSGMWTYDGYTWRQIGSSAEGMASWGNKLAVDFGISGIHIYDGNEWEWIGGNPEAMTAWSDKLAVDYGSYGLYVYDGNEWLWIAGNPENIAAWETLLVADFGILGIYVYDGNKWEWIGGNPQNIAAY